MVSAEALKARARMLGFNLVGLTPARPAPHLAAYLRWVAAGRHGEMGYLARPDRVARRQDLNVILPGVRTLVIVGLDFHTLRLPAEAAEDPTRGRIAAYAWGADYHAVMLPRLEALAAWLRAADATVRQRAYVDTGAVLERGHAQQAGLGFIGKNTMLIHPRRGSDFFLGELLTTAEFDVYDTPEADTRCGTCARCLAACPTAAFPQPYVLDARRCISYLTIELKTWVPRDLRPRMGRWLFGCDLCQTACPWGRFAVQTQETTFFPLAVDRAAPPLAEVLALDEAGFAARFAGTALARAGRERLVRNACIAAGNSRAEALRPQLEARLADPSALVRGHAAWALGQWGGAQAQVALQAALAREADPLVREELGAALAPGSAG